MSHRSNSDSAQARTGAPQPNTAVAAEIRPEIGAATVADPGAETKSGPGPGRPETGTEPGTTSESGPSLETPETSEIPEIGAENENQRTSQPSSPGSDANQSAQASPRTTHDAFFKQNFSDPALAASALQGMLPADIAARFDWDVPLELVHGSVVEQNFTQRHGDLLFKARLIEGTDAFMWVLFEHQSSVDQFMALRMARFQIDFIETWLRQNPDAKKLPAILPVVVYNGPRPWSAPQSLVELFDLTDESRTAFGSALLNLNYVLIDLTAATDDELRARPIDPAALLTIVVMKYVREREIPDHLELYIAEIQQLLQTTQGKVLWLHVVSYILVINEYYRDDTLSKALAHLVGPEMEKTMQTFGQRMIEQGFEQGIEQSTQKMQRMLCLLVGSHLEGEVPKSITRRIDQASFDQLERWMASIITTGTLDVDSLDDFFAD